MSLQNHTDYYKRLVYTRAHNIIKRLKIVQAEQELNRLKIFRAPYEVECTYLSKEQHTANTNILVLREERTHFLNRVCGDNLRSILPKHRTESRLDVG